MAVVSSQRKIGPGMRCDVPREVHQVHTFPTGSIFRAALCRPRTSGACLPYGGEGLVGYWCGESTTGEGVASVSADVAEEGGTDSGCACVGPHYFRGLCGGCSVPASKFH